MNLSGSRQSLFKQARQGHLPECGSPLEEDPVKEKSILEQLSLQIMNTAEIAWQNPNECNGL